MNIFYGFEWNAAHHLNQDETLVFFLRAALAISLLPYVLLYYSSTMASAHAYTFNSSNGSHWKRRSRGIRQQYGWSDQVEKSIVLLKQIHAQDQSPLVCVCVSVCVARDRRRHKNHRPSTVMKRKRFRCPSHTNLLSICKRSTKFVVVIWIQSLSTTTYTHFIWIFIFPVCAADHHIVRPPFSNSIIAQIENPFLWPIAAQAILQILYSDARACTSYHLCVNGKKRVSEERFDVSLKCY